MMKRRSHIKSRRGCTNCKRRHVKCDEQRPACAACTVRNFHCIYSLVQDDRPSDTASAIVRFQNRASTIRADTKWTDPGVPSPVVFSNTPEGDRLLELELMHRWSTRTWEALHSVPEDMEFLRVAVPRAALGETYLMNGILSLSAIDIAWNCRKEGRDRAIQNRYLVAALQYEQKATAEYRERLPEVTFENFLPAYYFGSSKALFHYLLPNDHVHVIDHVVGGLLLTYGSYAVMKDNLMGWISSGPSWFISLMDLLSRCSLDKADDETKKAVARIDSVARHFRESSVDTTSPKDMSSSSDSEQEGQASNTPSELIKHQAVVNLIRICMMVRGTKVGNGLCVGVGTAGGPPYLDAVKEREPWALFLFMHFGVALAALGEEPMAWWVGSIGKELVNEISIMLQQTQLAQLEDVPEAMNWAREKVGLPRLMTEVPRITNETLIGSVAGLSMSIE